MTVPRLSEDTLLRIGAGLAGVLFLAGSALAAGLAAQHMAALGTLCGASRHPHCSWCLGAVGLAAAGLTALAPALFGFRKSGLLQIKVSPAGI